MDQSSVDYTEITASVSGYLLVEYIDILAKADRSVLNMCVSFPVWHISS